LQTDFALISPGKEYFARLNKKGRVVGAIGEAVLESFSPFNPENLFGPAARLGLKDGDIIHGFNVVEP